MMLRMRQLVIYILCHFPILNLSWLVAPSVPFVQPGSKDAFAAGKKAGLRSAMLGSGKAVCSTSCESKFTFPWFSPYCDCANVDAANNASRLAVLMVADTFSQTLTIGHLFAIFGSS
jgi:hypothetical protein